MDRSEEWRRKALAVAVPALLPRTTDTELRARLREQAAPDMIAELAATGTVTAADIPEILRTHKATPALIIGLARHPEQLGTAISLLPHLHDTDLEAVVWNWDPRRYGQTDHPALPLPQQLLDAVLEQALTSLAATLRNPGAEDKWWGYTRVDVRVGLDFDGPAWRILLRCPERWEELVAHPSLGPAVQNLLLDQAETEARRDRLFASDGSQLAKGDQGVAVGPEAPAPVLSEDLLLACLPALCLKGLATLPQPSVSQLNRLHHIAARVRSNPRLIHFAAEPLAAAADERVRRGRLLTASRKKDRPGRLIIVAEDLALIGTSGKHLAKACALLAMEEQPQVVAALPDERLLRITDGIDRNSPVYLLEHHYQHQRVSALTALARNPHTPRGAVLDALHQLHVVELVWILHQADLPPYLREAVTALAPADADAGDGVLRLMSDDELAEQPDPAAVLQSWLDTPEPDTALGWNDVFDAILASRHRTTEHLRQLPADYILTHNLNVALSVLLPECGNDGARWAALLPALSFDYTDKRTFGQLLDALPVSANSE